MDDSFFYTYDQSIDADEHEDLIPYPSAQQQSTPSLEDPFAQASDAATPFAPINPGIGMPGPAPPLVPSLAMFDSTHEPDDLEFGDWFDFGAAEDQGGVDG